MPTIATVSPSAHVEVDVEQHLDRSVAELDVAELQHGDLDAGFHLVGACPFLLELLDDAPHVVLHEA